MNFRMFSVLLFFHLPFLCFPQSTNFVGVYNAETYQTDTSKTVSVIYHTLILNPDSSFIYKKINEQQHCDNRYVGNWLFRDNAVALFFLKADTWTLEIQSGTGFINLIYENKNILFSKTGSNLNNNKIMVDDEFYNHPVENKQNQKHGKKKKKIKEPDCFNFKSA